jgi:hypothetical protein
MTRRARTFDPGALALLLLLGCEARTDGDAGPRDDAASVDAATSDDAVVTDDARRGPWRSALFPEDWTPGFEDAEGRFLHDFSYAGYRLGDDVLGQDIVEMTYDVVTRGADATGGTDSTGAIQAAIDEASVGGGVVLFPEGLYRVEGRLSVRSSRVVLRGMGAERSRLHFPGVAGLAGGAHLTISGRADVDLEVPLAEDAATRDTSVRVMDASSLAPGDDVELGFVITPEYVEAHGMTGTWMPFNGMWQTFARRTVVAVEGDRVRLDVPLREAHLLRDGAALRRCGASCARSGSRGSGWRTPSRPTSRGRSRRCT